MRLIAFFNLRADFSHLSFKHRNDDVHVVVDIFGSFFRADHSVAEIDCCFKGVAFAIFLLSADKFCDRAVLFDVTGQFGFGFFLVEILIEFFKLSFDDRFQSVGYVVVSSYNFNTHKSMPPYLGLIKL